MKPLCIVMGIATIVGSYAFPLDAQESQTAEGAQRFLALQFDKGLLGGTEIHENGESDSFTIHWKILRSAESGDPCISNFRSAQIMRDGTQKAEYGDEFNWREEPQGVQDGTKVKFSFVHANSRAVKFVEFRSPDIAARAAYAMEFLRQNCDPAKGTGF